MGHPHPRHKEALQRPPHLALLFSSRGHLAGAVSSAPPAHGALSCSVAQQGPGVEF